MKNKRKIIKIFSILSIIMFACIVLSMLVLLLNIEQNKGIVPFVFMFSILFYVFSSYDFILPINRQFLSRKIEQSDTGIKVFSLIGFLLSVIFFIISNYVFWK